MDIHFTEDSEMRRQQRGIKKQAIEVVLKEDNLFKTLSEGCMSVRGSQKQPQKLFKDGIIAPRMAKKVSRRVMIDSGDGLATSFCSKKLSKTSVKLIPVYRCWRRIYSIELLMGLSVMNQRSRAIHNQIIQNYSALMGNAMNKTKDMPNRSECARDLLHETITKTLDYFSKGKGKELPLEELKFFMITVMENTSTNIKKSARSRLETEMPADSSAADSNADTVKIQRRAAYGNSSATEIDVVNADNELFPQSLSLQFDGERSISINQCWEKLEEEGRSYCSLI